MHCGQPGIPFAHFLDIPYASVPEVEPTRSAREPRRVARIRLVPLAPEVGQSLYQAETTLQGLELIETPESGFDLVALVEAVGIEPTSGNPPRQASTSIAGSFLLSPPLPPTGWLSGRPAPKSLAPHSRAEIRASPRYMTSEPEPR